MRFFNTLFVGIAIFNIKEEFIANIGQIVFVLIGIVIALTIFQFMLFVLLLFFFSFLLAIEACDWAFFPLY
ncbi:hypothetical protein OL548_18205 [Lysinibacillus sp. MHQ-1]|nr:hypothetical protein OL548_18205 [Lysinibacillus sp. MHQ-1]